MIVSLFLTATNHLLAQSDWARDRLRPHAGRHARLDLSPVAIAFAITDDGTFIADVNDAEPEVTLSLPLGDAMATTSGGLEALMAKAQVSGSVDLADALGFVFRHLRWDAEEDLAKLVGDIAAHRIVDVGERFLRMQHRVTSAAAQSLGGYLGKESTLLVPHALGESFGAELSALEAGLDRLEARIVDLKG